MKRKMTRTLSLILSVLMLVSAFSMISLADTPVFLTDYVDQTGTIQNSAYLYVPGLSGEKGDEYLAEWDGTTYKFEIGVNVFATFDEIFAAALTNPNVGDYPQILIPEGNYDSRLDINQGCEIYGVNWNTNPSDTNPTDYTMDWAENADWGKNGETIMSGPIVVGASLTGKLSIMGITMNCRFYDTQRGVSGAGTEITIKNVMVNHTRNLGGDGIPAPSGTYSNDFYVFSFQNYNNFNKTATASVNRDRVNLVNIRLKKVNTSTSNRFLHEYIAPYTNIDGLYVDVSTSGLQQFAYFKLGDYVPNAKVNITNSNLRNFTYTFAFEGYNKNPIGTVAGQTNELEFSNNVVYNCPNYLLNIYMVGYNKVDITRNNFLSTTVRTGTPYMSSGSALADVDLEDAVSFTYNRLIGYTNTNYEIANSTNRNPALMDVTGIYQDKSPLTENSQYETSAGSRPTGNYNRYDFFYTDYAMTLTSDRIPDLAITGGTVDNEAMTASYNVPSGTQSVTLPVDIDTSVAYYYTDKDFSDIDNIDLATPCIGNLPTGNLNNYYIIKVYSFDQLSYKLYKLTLTKDKSKNALLSRISTSSPAGTSLTQDGNYWYAGIPQTSSTYSFTLTQGLGCSVKVMDGSKELSPSVGRYTVTDVGINDKEITISVTSADGSETEVYKLFVSKARRSDCELISIDGTGLNKVSDTAFEATIPYTQDSYELTLEISDGATATVWSGTSVFTRDSETGKVVIDEIQSGKVTYNILITAEDGISTTAYTLVIDRVLNSEAELKSIKGATKEGGNFVAEATGSFVVDATVSDGATYKVYSDAQGKNEISKTVPVTVSDKVVYIIVTAQDGVTKSSAYKLTIKSKGGFEIANAQLDASNTFIINAQNDLTSYKLDVKTKNASYKIYADSALKFEAGNTININQGETIVYIKVTYSDKTTATYPILIVSKRSEVKFKDQSSIANWAKPYVDAINKSGLGLLVGDENGNFNPKNSLTRYEISVIGVKLMGADASKFANVKLNFSDSIASWALNYVKAAYTLGIMSGNDNGSTVTFDGQNPTQRQQFARIFMEVICTGGMGMSASEYYEQNKSAIDAAYSEYKFEDENTVQTWAKPYVKLMVISGFMSGSLNNGKYYIEGQKAIVRQEVAVILSQALSLIDE